MAITKSNMAVRTALVAALASSWDLSAWGQGRAAAAADAPADARVSIELNKLEPVENACEIYLLLENHTAQNFDALQLELVSFDAKGVVSQRVAVDLAPLQAGKTHVKLFDIPETSCDNISRLLLNDVLGCRGPAGPIANCQEQLRPSSRATVPFWR